MKVRAAGPLRPGFTIIELLVVIAIIGLIVALLLPAMQAARESARVVHCRNNVKQLAVGCLTHLETQRFWPSGGWGFTWTGEADRGFGKAQPGGWAYSVLPFVEQTALHQLGAGLTDATQRMARNSQRAATPVAAFYCPSRRSPTAIKASDGWPNVEMTNAPTPAAYAKTDYAINIGDTEVGGECLPPGPPASCLNDYPGGSCFDAGEPGATSANWYGNRCNPKNFDGISTHRSEMPASEVVDGMSVTLLLAEKNLDPKCYLSSGNPSLECGADNGDAWQGRDWDTSRWTVEVPMRDTPGCDQAADWQKFGGPHSSGVVAAACDGAVRVVTFQVDAGTWKRLGNCQDTTTGSEITSWPGQ